jgi:glycine cleavage system H lipoate-binding protein
MNMTVLFVIGTILFFLALDWIVRRVRGTSRVPVHALQGPVHYPVRVPGGIFFARSHTWLNLLPSGKLRLGIDDFIGRMLENPDIILLKHEGDPVKRGEPIFSVVSGDRSLFVRSPIDCEILGVNEQLGKDPTAQREQLFSDGWGYVIQPNRISQLKDLLLGPETKAWIRDEFRRMGDFLAGVGRIPGIEPSFLQDGGLPSPGILEKMKHADWQEFEREFLQVQ